ncbi:SDR family NAD(P)-dependent oxidoreductase [Mycetocola zhadangensis]|uniref:SDR family NAD(P)-dependent oxidoreductase n=1 Tax=Mycetocola zhadangensis TaxID=1164595 RepID=UPI003A4E140F
MDTERLSGKIAVITGSNSGIGAATARRFLAEGATVVAADRDPSRNPLVLARTDRVMGIACDVSEPQAIENLGVQLAEHFGRVDILVNNAGITGAIGRVHEYALEDYEKVMNTNVRGPFLTMRATIPLMLAAGGGSIVNVSSIGAVTFTPGSSPYSPSKAALLMMSKQAAIEYVKDGIRVNAVCPGLVETPILGGATDTLDLLANAVPMGRLGTPEEVAALIAYLASDEAGFTTGSATFIDGGHTAI